MKRILLFLLLFATTFYSKAQTTCKDTLFKVSKTSLVTEYDTIPVQHITTWSDTVKALSVSKTYDTVKEVKCGRWCQAGIVAPRTKIVSINEHLDSSYTTTIIIHSDTTYSLKIDSTLYTIIVTVDSLGKVCVTIPSSTQFGAKITQGSFADQDKALKALGVKVVRPNGITLSTWVSGSKSRLDDFLNAGYFCIVNVTWDQPSPNSIYPFCTNLTLYASKLDALVKQYAPWKDKIIWAFENEEYNRSYYSGPISNYITLLNSAIGICSKYDMAVTDGALAVEFVNMIVNSELDAAIQRREEKKPAGRYDEQLFKTDSLINAFAAITYSKFSVNVHRKFTGTSYTGNDLLLSCNYLRQKTGKSVLSNEHHLEEATESLVYDVVPKWEEAGVTYCLIWDESKAQGGAITDGFGNLTDGSNNSTIGLGEAYRDAIK